jgi:hypothetical protein
MVKARNLLNWAQQAMGRAGRRPWARVGGAALLALPLALSACGGESTQNLLARATAPCPNVGIISDAADLTRFRQGSQADLTALVVNASISGFQAKCDYAPKRDGLVVTLTPTFIAERGPASAGPTADIPYMVAVVGDNDQVLSRAAYTLRVEFPPNVAKVTSRGEEVSITLAGTPAEAARRNVLIGFVLSPDELAANRRRGPR